MTEPTRVPYAREPALRVREFRRVLMEAGLRASRPVEHLSRLGAMLAAADLILTARLHQPGTPLVGVAWCITDFTWCCYLSELAVSASAQGLGVGTGLLDEVRQQLGLGVSLILASVPEAVGFYERTGMTRVPDAFWSRRKR